jgi:hypothetical protein
MQKTLVSLVCVCCCVSSLFAEPKLQLQIENTIKNQNFALCLSNSCYLLTSKPVFMDGNDIDSIIMTDTGTLAMYGQTIPASCKLSVKNNQTLTVSGKLIKKKWSIEVENLQCSVAVSDT